MCRLCTQYSATIKTIDYLPSWITRGLILMLNLTGYMELSKTASCTWLIE